MTPTNTPTNTATPTTTTTNTPTNSATPTETITQTPSQTQTQTPTNTATPTTTLTNTPTTTTTSTTTQTPTQTQTQTTTTTSTPTPSPTQQALLAYLTIEPQGQSSNFNGWMSSQNSSWRGFFINGAAVSSAATFNQQFNAYLNYSGWGGNSPAIRTGIISPTTPNPPQNDAYGNQIFAYLFQTTQIPAGTTPGLAWYTWYVPTGATNGQIMTQIGINIQGNANNLTVVNMNSGYYNNIVTYTGTTIPQGTYRVYTSYSNTFFRINASVNTIYFRGNTLT
jgi:hypothetical protein